MAEPERSPGRVRLRLDDPSSVDDVLRTAIKRAARTDGPSLHPEAEAELPPTVAPRTLPASLHPTQQTEERAVVPGGAAERPAVSFLRSHRGLVEWVVVLGGALILAVLVKSFLIQAFFIPSASMQPTLTAGDRVLVNKLSYDLHDANRGDLIVFRKPADTPTDQGADDLIKRVIGLPGESVEIRLGDVYVDGEPLDEPYLAEDDHESNFGPIRVPVDHVFVLGDNRLSSRDSRSFGAVPVDEIVGRAFMRIWPPQGIGFL